MDLAAADPVISQIFQLVPEAKDQVMLALIVSSLQYGSFFLAADWVGSAVAPPVVHKDPQCCNLQYKL